MIPFLNRLVKKTGDTMTGVLKIENKSNFDGVTKTRTVNDIDYTAKLGVGSDGSAVLELGSNGDVLGRINITPDGRIKNYFTNQYLLEDISDWSTATIDKTYLSGGKCQYIKLGKIVLVSIMDMVVSNDASSGAGNAVFFSGLPIPKSELIQLMQQHSSSNAGRIKINTDGQITNWYQSFSTSDKQWYGFFMYIAKE